MSLIKPVKVGDAPKDVSQPEIDLARFASAAYHPGEQIDGWERDEDLSDRNAQTYTRINPETGVREAVLAGRGTDLGSRNWARDLSHDALILTGLSRFGAREKGHIQKAKRAEQKYGRENLWLTGHSLSGSTALRAHAALGTEDGGVKTVVYNPGLSTADIKRGGGRFSIEHLLPRFGGEPVRFGRNARIKAVKGDVISSLAPYVDAEFVEIQPRKKGVDPHRLKGNFV